jgi:hypothetical protein
MNLLQQIDCLEAQVSNLQGQKVRFDMMVLKSQQKRIDAITENIKQLRYYWTAIGKVDLVDDFEKAVMTTSLDSASLVPPLAFSLECANMVSGRLLHWTAIFEDRKRLVDGLIADIESLYEKLDIPISERHSLLNQSDVLTDAAIQTVFVIKHAA